MIEIDEENNPPQTFTFARKDLFQKLIQMPDVLSKIDDWTFYQLIEGILQNTLKSQTEIDVSNGQVRITLFQPCGEDAAVLGV